MQHTRQNREPSGRTGHGGSFFSAATIQPKLSVNQPGDDYEKEADHTADRVMRMPDTKAAGFFRPAAGVMRKCKCEEEAMFQRKSREYDEEKIVQRKCSACEEKEKLHRKEAAGSEPEVTPAVSQTLASSGHAMDSGTLEFMEGRFGYDFSQVRIHNDAQAHESSNDIQALAYTHQNHIAFGEGQYQPHSEEGRHLLAHELTHVIQQTGGVQTKAIQRKGNFGPGPKRASGEFGHALALPEMTRGRKNTDLFTEAPIPGATKDGLMDIDKAGFADFYNAKTILGLRLIHGEPAFLKPLREIHHSGDEFNPAGQGAPAGGKHPPRIRRLKEAPDDIRIGDLKPPVAKEIGWGVQQIKAYQAGIKNTANEAAKYITAHPKEEDTKTSWSPAVGPLTSLDIPGSLNYAKGGLGVKPMKLYAYSEGSKDGVPTDLHGSMFVYNYHDVDSSVEGIWIYEWIPDDAPVFTTGELQLRILDRLNKEVIPNLRRKEKPRDKVQRDDKPPAFNYGQWSAQEYGPWKTDAEKLLSDKTYHKDSAAAEALLDVRQRVPGAKNKLKAPPETEKLAGGDKKIRFWKSYGGIFGRLRSAFGSVYTRIATVFDTIKGKVAGFFSGNKDPGMASGSSIIAKVASVLIGIIKRYVASVFQKVGAGLKTSLITGVKNVLQELFADAVGEDFLNEIKGLTDLTELYEQFRENEYVKSILEYLDKGFQIVSIFEQIKDFWNKARDIEELVEDVVAAIQCVTPPVAGCIKVLFKKLTEWAIAQAIGTCYFQTRIFVPLFNTFSFFRELPNKIVKSLVDLANDHIPLPSFIHSKLLAPVPISNTAFDAKDLSCNDNERTNAINLAFGKLRTKYTPERVDRLLEIMKKRGVGDSQELDLDLIGKLDKALDALSDVNDATLLAIGDDSEKDKASGAVATIEEFVTAVKETDRSFFDLGESDGARLAKFFYVGHLPLGAGGRMKVSISDHKPCKEWHTLAIVYVMAEPDGETSDRKCFKIKENLTFKLGGDQTLRAGECFWAFKNPAICVPGAAGLSGHVYAENHQLIP